MKVRIKSLPKSENGSQINNQFQGKQINWPGFSDSSTNGPRLKTTLGPIARNGANVEAEKGEVAIADMNFDGIPEHFVVGGQRHSSGGTPLNLPPDSFIFSDTQKMKIRDKEILARFGMGKGSYTPADIAKKYNINKYRGVLYDKDADRIQHESAERMIQNYNQKLGELALIQESKKGFPQGIPTIAMPYLETHGIDPQQFLPQSPAGGQPNMQGEDMAIQDGMEQQPMMRFGGFLPKAQPGVEIDYPWYEDLWNGTQEVLTGMEKGTNYLAQYPNYWFRGSPDYAKPRYEMPSQTMNRIGALGNGLEDPEQWVVATPQDTVPRSLAEYNKLHPYLTPEEALTTDVMRDPALYLGYGAPAKALGQTAYQIGSKATSLVKNFGALPQILLRYVAQGLMTLEEAYRYMAKMKVGKYIVPAIERASSIAGKTGNGSTQSSTQAETETETEVTEDYKKELEKDSVKTPPIKEIPPNIPTIRQDTGKVNVPTFMRYGGNLPKAQSGAILKTDVANDGSTRTTYADVIIIKDPQGNEVRRIPVTNSGSGKGLNDPAIRPIPWSKVDTTKYDIIYPKGYIDEKSPVGINPNAFDVPRVQDMDKPSHTYGDYDMVDFKETRWKGYFDKKKSWDPTPTTDGTNKRGEKYKYSKDVLDFQAHVNDTYIKAGLPPYFDGTPGFELDGLLKDHTYSAPAVVEKKKEPTMAEPGFGHDIRPNPEVPTAQRNVDAPWYAQDENNYGLALNNLYGIHRYMPWQAVPDNKYLTPTLYDPERELAANSEMVNQGVQGAATFTDPQAFNARFAQMQGSGSKNAADILSRYNNMNVGVANQTNAANTASYNQYSREKANLATSLFDKYTTVNQQFDNSRRQAKTEVVKALNQGITNSANTQAMNSLYDNYQIDPTTGGRLKWVPGGYERFHANAPTDDYADVWELYKTAKSQVGDKAALKILEAALANRSKKEKNIDLPIQYPTPTE